LILNHPGTLLMVFCALLILKWVALEATSELSMSDGTTTLFRPVLGLRLLFGLGLPFSLYAIANIIESHGNPKWAFVTFALLFIAIMLVWPPTLKLTPQGIRSTSWFGITTKGFRWSEIDYAAIRPASHSIEVVSRDGAKIVHTQYHVDASGFLELLRGKCLIWGEEDDRRL